MGADARWVCHTCRTVCERGGRPIFQPTRATIGETKDGIDELKKQLAHINTFIELDDFDRKINFLDDLYVWLGRHEEHDIHVGSDYSTDMMDLDDYYDETVDGKISKLTRHEVQLAAVNVFEENAIKEIEAVLKDCVTGDKSIKDAAQELYNRFSTQSL